MKERSILFSSPMIRAILEGRKTQTRRVIKPQPAVCKFAENGVYTYSFNTDEEPDDFITCPYFQDDDDSLWVRETWGMVSPELGDSWWYETVKNRKLTFHPDSDMREGIAAAIYRADGDFSFPADWRKWRPSIHMPRWASRIDLGIGQVRVERLQDISENDARAEGVEPDIDTIPFYGEYKDPFYRLWQSINAKRPGCTWDDNPWVWVIEFRQKGGDNGK